MQWYRATAGAVSALNSEELASTAGAANDWQYWNQFVLQHKSDERSWLPLREHLNLNLYCLNKADKDGGWSTTNALATEVAWEF